MRPGSEQHHGSGTHRRRDPLRWIRRRALPWIGRFSVLAGLALVAAWIAGRVRNDADLWSQWLWWLPTVAVAAAALLAAGVSWACEKLGLRLAGATGRPLLVVAALCLIGWWSIAEANLHRVFAGTPGFGGPTLTVGYWNMAWSVGDERAGGPGFAADVLIAANPRPGEGRRDLLAALLERQRAAGLREPTGTDDSDDTDDPDQAGNPPTAVHVASVLGGSAVVTRDPILRTGRAMLDGRSGSWAESRNGSYQNGIAFVTLDTTARLGRETTIWIVDAPSDPLAPRTEIMAALAEAARGWTGPVRAPDHIGRWRSTDPDTPGFPEPDLIVGDFNATRGSRSIGKLVGDRAESHAVAGVGPDRTFYSSLPLWAIDLAHASDGWRWVGSDTLEAGGPHRAIIVEAVPVDTPSP